MFWVRVIIGVVVFVLCAYAICMTDGKKRIGFVLVGSLAGALFLSSL